MKEICPRCGYNFADYIKKGISAPNCPSCYADMRMFEVSDDLRKCRSCGFDIWEQALVAKKSGKKLENCPICLKSLEEVEIDNKNKCTVCGTSLEDAFIDGSISFMGSAKLQGEQYVTFGMRGNNLNINVKCRGCGGNLNYNSDFYNKLVDIQHRLTNSFKIGDF